MIIFQISYFGPLMWFSLIFLNHQTEALSTAPFDTLSKNDENSLDDIRTLDVVCILKSFASEIILLN